MTGHRGNGRAVNIDGGDADEDQVQDQLDHGAAQQALGGHLHPAQPLQAAVDGLVQGGEDQRHRRQAQDIRPLGGVWIQQLEKRLRQHDQARRAGQDDKGGDQEGVGDLFGGRAPVAHGQRRRNGGHQHGGKGDVQGQGQVGDVVRLVEHTVQLDGIGLELGLCGDARLPGDAFRKGGGNAPGDGGRVDDPGNGGDDGTEGDGHRQAEDLPADGPAAAFGQGGGAGTLVFPAVEQQHDDQIAAAQGGRHRRGGVGSRCHDGCGVIRQGQDEYHREGRLEDLLQKLGAVVGGHILPPQEPAPDHRRDAHEKDGGAEGPQGQLDAVHLHHCQGDKVGPPVQQQRRRQADAGKQRQRCAEDALGALTVVQGQPLRHHLGDGVGDAHRRDGQQHGVDLVARGAVAVARVAEARDIDDDEVIGQTQQLDEELAAQNGGHVVHKGVFSFFHRGPPQGEIG